MYNSRGQYARHPACPARPQPCSQSSCPDRQSKETGHRDLTLNQTRSQIPTPYLNIKHGTTSRTRPSTRTNIIHKTRLNTRHKTIHKTDTHIVCSLQHRSNTINVCMFWVWFWVVHCCANSSLFSQGRIAHAAAGAGAPACLAPWKTSVLHRVENERSIHRQEHAQVYRHHDRSAAAVLELGRGCPRPRPPSSRERPRPTPPRDRPRTSPHSRGCGEPDSSVCARAAAMPGRQRPRPPSQRSRRPFPRSRTHCRCRARCGTTS
jgi:hypothetical protein